MNLPEEKVLAAKMEKTRKQLEERAGIKECQKRGKTTGKASTHF